jgi:cellulose biosynthesis protein BcsQ
VAIQISLFNHKGGVSKTTTAFNLGWKLANKGKRVLLVDCDPQCNLSGMVLGFKAAEELEKVYSGEGVRNIKEGLAPAFESRPTPIKPVVCEAVSGNADLFLLPGHIGLAEYEVTLGIAQELSGSLVTLQNLPGSVRHLFQATAAENNIDIILIDMSPSLGPINQNLLMTSELFLVPMAPDYFSVMATDSLATVVPKWNEWRKKAIATSALQNATYPFPTIQPKFLGTVVQKYRLRAQQSASAAFQKWIDEIESGVKNKLIPALKSCDMVFPETDYEEAGIKLGEPILQMSDFNSLIALSQKHQAPVFALTDDQLEQTGIVLERTKKSMGVFDGLFSEAAERVLRLLEKHGTS